jgi:hypothetical protein
MRAISRRAQLKSLRNERWRRPLSPEIVVRGRTGAGYIDLARPGPQVASAEICLQPTLVDKLQHLIPMLRFGVV